MDPLAEKQSNNWAAFGAAALALLLVIVTIFIEWGAVDASAEFTGGGGGGFDGATPFTLFQFGDTSWFDNDMDPNDGIGQVRTGIVLVLVGAAIGLAGTAILAIPSRMLARGVIAGAALCLAGAIVVGLGTLMHHLGTLALADSLNQSSGGVQTTGSMVIGTGLIMAYVAAVLFLAAGIVGLTWNPSAGDGRTAA